MNPKLILLFFVYTSLNASAAPHTMPGKLVSRCERLLADKGWLNRTPLAQVYLPGWSSVEIRGKFAHSKVLQVRLGGESEPEPISRTDRDISDLISNDKHFPTAFFRKDQLSGKKILDLACGEGFGVEQLLREGLDVVGLDLHLTPYMRTKPYFVQASAANTPFADGQFDIIYSAQGPFKYFNHRPEMMEAMMKEAHRILKKGGVLRLSPIHGVTGEFFKYGARPEIDLKNTIFTQLPRGMRIKSAPSRDWFFFADPGGEGHTAHYWLEIERID